jgi:hypothetical protein
MVGDLLLSGPQNGGHPPIFKRFQMGVRIKSGCTNQNFRYTNSVRLVEMVQDLV